MSLADDIRNEAHGLIETGLRGIFDAAQRRRLRKEAKPCLQARFHREMERRLPKWRLIARAIHRSEARRWAARCAAEAAENPIGKACEG